MLGPVKFILGKALSCISRRSPKPEKYDFSFLTGEKNADRLWSLNRLSLDSYKPGDASKRKGERRLGRTHHISAHDISQLFANTWALR